MSHPRILAVDVGTGTQDILVFEAGTVIENAVQLVMPSPTVLVAERVKQATADRADLLLTGVTMGGGPDHWAIESHLREGLRVYATPEAGRTFDDDLARVEAMGIRIVDRPESADGARRLEMRDLYWSELMEALARTWTGSAPLFVMDTGPAAILGALDDPTVASADPVLLVNVGNFHTIATLLDGRRIAGLFEHHTGELTKPELEVYLQRLAAGTLSNQEVFDDMGHGALMNTMPARLPELLAVTGPRRGLLQPSRLNPHYAVPHGDMMLAGCFGLLHALAVRLPEFAPAIREQLGTLADPSPDSRGGKSHRHA